MSEPGGRPASLGIGSLCLSCIPLRAGVKAAVRLSPAGAKRCSYPPEARRLGHSLRKPLRRPEKRRSGLPSAERPARPFRLARAVVGLRWRFSRMERPAAHRFLRERPSRRAELSRPTPAEPRRERGAMRPGRSVSSKNAPQALRSAEAPFRHCRSDLPYAQLDANAALEKPEPERPSSGKRRRRIFPPVGRGAAGPTWLRRCRRLCTSIAGTV